MSLATMLSRILGLVREQLIATLFSRTATDAFYVSFRIPNLLRDLFAEGAMSSAFIPTFTEYLKNRSRKEAWELASNVMNLLLVGLSGVALLGILGSQILVGRFAGEFAATPGKFELTVLLTQVMFPFLPMVALAAVLMGVLNSQGTLFVPALAPALFNVGSLAVALALYRWLPAWGFDPVLGMAIGTLLGGALQLCIQLPALVKKGFVYSAVLTLRHPGVRQILLLMGPGTIGLASTQINILVNTWLATSQGEGPVSWLNYAFRLMQFPLGLFGVSIAAATLPRLSAHVADGELEGLRKTLASAMRLVLVINIPASFGLAFLSGPIIALAYEHGKFGPADTLATARALVFYSVGLFAYSGIKVLVPAFYALGRPRVPVIISSVSVAINIALNFWLVVPLGYLGLALSTSLSAIGNLVLLFWQLRKSAAAFSVVEIFILGLKMGAASLGMGLLALQTQARVAASVSDGSVASEALVLGLAIAIGIAGLYAACRLMRVEEVETMRTAARRKLAALFGGS